MPQSQDDAEINTQNVSLEEIKAAAPRLEMPDLDEPEDNCIICLQAVEDRTVLPECAHDRMCFECIKKWTDQSRRCPLCNTPIGSHLIHRIRSEYDYQKHFLEPLRTSLPPTHIVAEARAVYRARTRRPSEVEQDNLERAIEKRRWVYRHGLFAKHIASNPHTRFRPNPTPSQINNSPELQSRCQMFVRRELRVWPNLDVEFLTSFILSLAKSIDIRTESAVKLISEFLDINRRPSPSGGTVAEHFVHEFYSYLRSPFRDLPAYDAVVEYDTPDDIEPPPPTTSRPQHQRQNEAGPSRSRHRGGHSPSPPRSPRRYDLDDPLDASPRDADQDSEMDMDEHWIEVPPSRRDRPSRRGWDDEPRGGESRRRRESSRWDRESRQGREEVDSYREEPRRDREHSRDREAHRRERSPTLGRSPSPKREPEPSSRREKEPRLSRGERSPVSRRERSPEPRRHKESRRHKWRSPSPRRDRKGKRLEDQYEQRNKRKHYGGRESSDDERRDPKGKGRQRGYDKTSRRLDDEMRERGAEEAGFSRGGKDGGEGMPRDHDESRQRDNDERWRKNNDADTRRDNDEQKGNDNTRNRWNDDGGSAAQYRDEGKAHHRRFSGSSRRYDERASPSDSDQRPWHGGYDQRPSFSSHHRPPTDDNDDRYPTRRSHPHEERTPYKSGQATSREYDQGSSTHVRQGSDEYKRSSKRTRSPSPKSKKDESGRDQKRPAVDTQHVDNHYSRRPHRSLSASSTSSAITRSYDDHGLDDGAQQPMSISRGAQTRSSSLSRRPAAHHNVQEPKTPEVERSSTARHAAHTQFGLTSPGVDQTLSTQPGDKTGLDTRDKTQLDTRDKTRTDVRARAPRLTPLASIRAHLQGPSRPSEPLSEGLAIKGSPTRSTTNLESSATNYPSAPGPTLLPNAVERLPMALNDINTNPIHISPGSDGSSVSYSILGAAARSQVQPPLITASPDSAQRVSPNSTMGRNRLLQARLEALRAATNSDVHASHLSANSPASPTLPDTAGNQSATNSGHDDHALATSQNGQLGADPADVNTPAARFEAERRLKLQARLAARKREINAVMGGTPR